MIPLAEGRARVFDGCEPLTPGPVGLAKAVGCVTSSALVASELVPPFDNTAMDGFAVRSADTAGASESDPVTLDVVATLAAGRAPDRTVGPGEAVRIMTGAPVPDGADAVVMVELTRTAAGNGGVDVLVEVPVGNHLRPAGDDLGPGDTVFGPRTELTAAHIGVLASLGISEADVYPRARVGVLSTGDELVEGADPLAPGQIRDSNRCMLVALVAQAGCEAIDLGLIPDDEAAIEAAFRRGAGSCDAVVSSGGVSMGDFDYVKAVLDRIGDMEWMQVAIKPAKPLAFGVVDGTPVFGLPGNPVSSMVSFELFARPALRRMMGHPRPDRVQVVSVVDEDLRRRPDGKVHFVRVVASYGADDRYHVRSSGGQGSHQLSAMAAANALAVVSDGDGLGTGALVPTMMLSEPTAPGGDWGYDPFAA